MKRRIELVKISEGEYAVPEGTSDINSVLVADEDIVSLTLPESIKFTTGSSFRKCLNPVFNTNRLAYVPRSQDQSFFIKKGINTIGCGACGNCVKLPYVNIPDSVTIIENGAFMGCESLSILEIPEHVESIGMWAFRDCLGLVDVKIGDNLKKIGQGIFRGCPNIRTPIMTRDTFIYMPQSFEGEYTIPDGIETIASEAFENCSHITKLNLPTSIKTIPLNAFIVTYKIGEANCEEQDTDLVAKISFSNSDLMLEGNMNMFLLEKNYSIISREEKIRILLKEQFDKDSRISYPAEKRNNNEYPNIDIMTPRTSYKQVLKELPDTLGGCSEGCLTFLIWLFLISFIILVSFHI